MASLTWKETISEIFSSWAAVASHIANRSDSETRNPQLILELARNLALLPPRESTLLVTGSKGKGTVARCVAELLRIETNTHVGLLISPQETEHNDRIRTNGAPASQAEVIQSYEFIRPHLIKLRSSLGPTEYLSPSGIFLLIGLYIFKRRGCSYFVLETGRGARFDEVGQIPAKVSIVTSILSEHLELLGPTLKDVAWHKFGIGDERTRVITTEEAAHLSSRNDLVISPRRPATDTKYPQWLTEDFLLASDGTQILLDRPEDGDIPSLPLEHLTGSFISRSVNGVRYIGEAAIASASLDREWLGRILANKHQCCVLLSVPDDKDCVGIPKLFASFGIIPSHLTLLGVPSLSFTQSEYSDRFGEKLTCAAADTAVIKSWIEAQLQNSKIAVIYGAGTQSFFRLWRRVIDELDGANVLKG